MTTKYIRSANGVVFPFEQKLIDNPASGFVACNADGSDWIEAPEGATSDMLGGLRVPSMTAEEQAAAEAEAAAAAEAEAAHAAESERLARLAAGG